MHTLTIFHNPRCSKSRAACALIAESSVEAEVIDYLMTPPTRDELRVLLAKLGMRAGEIVRRGEAVFKENYQGRELSDEQWLDALIVAQQSHMTTCNAARLEAAQIRVKQLMALRNALAAPGGASTGHCFD